ncbi:unnamed protein product [Meloidogyne enterolobii]|uniref:Uncharacterized protein n=1 Tax=Meloidogyne enterolobii TaxID=390850 RepID=A0ACB0YME7_MELEN
MEGILHKQTGEILTFVEAIRQGLLDLSSGGEFFDIVSGSRVSLDKAVEMGYISENITEILNGRHGIRHPETGQELTLMEAIQIGLYDPDSRQLRDIKTGELLSLFDSRHICPTDVQHRLIKMGVLKLPPMELEQALKNGVLNPQTGEFRGKFVQEAVTFRDALANGYIQFPSGQPLLALTLTDCIEDGFIDSHSGEFIDKSGERFTLREALDRQRPLIRDNTRECVNTALNQRVTVAEAVLANALNPRTGKFTDLQSRIELSLKEAHDYGLIQASHYDSNGLFLDRGNRFTLLEAINAGWLDPDVRHIVSEQDQEVISIADALERGLLTPDGRIKLDSTESAGAHGRQLDLYDAQRQGLLIRRIRHTIFDVKGIRNTENNANLSFNEAVEAGILQLPSERVVDQHRRQNYSLSDAVREGILDSALADILSSPSGLSENGVEVTLIRAVAKGLVDAKKGVIIDRSQRELSVREAYSNGIFGSLRAAMRLAALFDVHPLLMTAVKKRHQTRKRIHRPGTVSGGALPEDQVKVTLAEAMRMGLVDARTQRFRQGKNEMSLDDALHQGLIDPHSEWIVPSRASGVGPTIEERTQETVTETGQQLAPKIFPDKELQESVQTVHRVKRTETSAVGGPGGVSVYRAVTGGKDSIEVPENGFHVLEAERKGLLDLNTGIVRPPGTDKSLNLEEACLLGVLNPSSVSIRDTQSGRSLKIDEALKQKLIDRHGFVEHHGRRLSLQQAIDERIAHVEPEPPALITGAKKKLIQFSSAVGAPVAFRPVGHPVVEESEHAWTFDSNRGVFIDLNTKESIPLDSAIRSGHLSPDDLRARDALTGREFTLTEAEKWGIVNIREGYYLDKTDNKRYSFTEAARQHRIYPTGGVPENAADALQTTVRVHKRTEVATKEAVPTTASGVSGFHSPTDYNLNRYVDQRHFEPSTGLFTHPDVQKQMTLKELIIKGLLNPYSTKIVDRVKGTELRLLDAIQENIVDDVAGTVRDTQTGKVYDFSAAVRQGLVKEDLRPLAIESTSHVPVFEERRASRISAGGGSPKLVERKLQLTPYAQEPFRRSAGESLSPPSVRRSGSAGGGSLGETGFGSGRGTSTWSIGGGGPTQPKQHRLSGTVADSSPSYFGREFSSTTAAPTGAVVSGPLGTLTGPNERMVDLGGGKTVKVNVIRGADGLEKGEYFDPASNMKFTIQLHGDPITTQTSTKVRSTSQVQSVELEPHAQFVGIDQIKDLRNGRVMSLADAQRLGLARVDRKGRLSTREYSAFRSNIELAVNKGVMNARGEKLSLEEAIRQRLIDIRELKYIHPRNGEAIDLSSAANQGLVDVTLAETLPSGIHHPGTGEKISVRRAIDLGIIDARTGAVRHPFTGEPLSWVDLTRKVYNAITQNGVYDPRKGYAIPVTSALADGLIDSRSGGIYINPITQERHSLEEASQRGMIDSQTLRALTEPCLTDYQTRRRINLIQAVEAKLIDPRAKTVQLSADKIVSLQKAIEEGAIPAEVGDHLRRVDKLTFAEAVGKGLIDVAQDRYTCSETGKQMTIAEAVSQGLIDTGTVKSGDEPGEKTNLARVIASDEFEERSGRVQDPQTRLYLPFSAAVSQRLVDPDSLLHDLNSSKTITLREALNLGLIDSQGRYVPKTQPGQHTSISPVPLKEAVQRGLIALIGSPMQAAQAVSEALKRRDAEGYKFRLEPLDDATLQRLSTGSGRSPIQEETIIRTRRPREPSLSERVRSSGGYSGDGDVSLRGSRVRSGDVDPLALADLQNDFIALLQQQGFDVDEKCVENPSTMRMMSIREAVESGLFDVSTGNIVNPISGRYYPVNRAISMRLVQTSPEKGQKLSDALAQAHEKYGGLPAFRRSEQQFSPGSVSLGSYAGVSDPYQRRSSFGIEVDTSPTSLPPINNRLSWSFRNVDWRGDTAELRSRPELADVRHASVERGIDGNLPPGMPVPSPTTVIGQTGTDFHRDIEEFRRGEPSEGPLNIDRTRTHISPDGQTRTTTHYTHHRSEY